MRRFQSTSLQLKDVFKHRCGQELCVQPGETPAAKLGGAKAAWGGERGGRLMFAGRKAWGVASVLALS